MVEEEQKKVDEQTPEDQKTEEHTPKDSAPEDKSLVPVSDHKLSDTKPSPPDESNFTSSLSLIFSLWL